MRIYRFKRPYLHLQAIEGMMIVDGKFKLTYNTIKLVRLPIIIVFFRYNYGEYTGASE